jgi:hypothetical protein
MQHIKLRGDYEMDAMGKASVQRKMKKCRTDETYSAELRRKLVFAQHRRYLSNEPVTLPRVAWMERPDITKGW